MGPLRWRGRRRLAGRQCVEALVGVAQARKGENAGQGGIGGDAPRRRHDRGVAEVTWESGVPGVSDEPRWSAEVVGGAWSTGKWRGSEEQKKFRRKKTRGGRARREAEVAVMAAPKLAEWHGVWCPRRAS
jgi:hypothetical protein